MQVYVTFGQVHVHRVNNKTFDCDSVACIEANSAEEGRKLAFEYFGDKFHNTYYGTPPDMSYFPRGIISVEAPKTRCEGWRRYGGAFSFGKPRWVQCEMAAVVTLRVKQDNVISDQPACLKCWNEAKENKIPIISATAL